MITCIMLIQCERQQISQVATQLAELTGVSEVYSVSGHYDLVAILNVPGTDALSELVTRQLAAVEGIRSTETMLSLRAYGKREMEAMFDIGGALPCASHKKIRPVILAVTSYPCCIHSLCRAKVNMQINL